MMCTYLALQIVGPVSPANLYAFLKAPGVRRATLLLPTCLIASTFWCSFFFLVLSLSLFGSTDGPANGLVFALATAVVPAVVLVLVVVGYGGYALNLGALNGMFGSQAVLSPKMAAALSQEEVQARELLHFCPTSTRFILHI